MIITTTESITTDSGRRDAVHMRLTTPGVFIRFEGNGLHPTDYTRIDQWVNRIKDWTDKGIQSVYLFMHQHNELHSPQLCKYLTERINKTMGASLPVPTFVE